MAAAKRLQTTAADATGSATLARPEPSSSASKSAEGIVKMDDSTKVNEAAPRTHEVLMAEVRYGIVFGEMNEVFNGRVHRFLSFLWISAAALTGGALLTLLGRLDPTIALPWTISLGIVAAVAGAAQKAFKFQDRETKFRETKAAFQEVEGRGWSMNQSALQKELAKLRAKAPSGGTWLAPLAYNRACRELGHPEVQMPVPKPLKLAAGLAA
jgi:hypothetical protein